MYKIIFKPLLDRVLALFMIIVILPFIVMISLIVLIGMGRPVFFKQVRPGFQEALFTIYKFRTMTNEQDENGVLLPDEQRLKPIGRFIRSLSLDELPQLWNVLKGEMSFIGPRPLLVEYLTLYNDEQKRRHHVKPGITGWAQVNGRNAISWREKFEYDRYYVEHLSFGLDMKIIWMTAKRVFARTDISTEGHATTEKFNGKN